MAGSVSGLSVKLCTKCQYSVNISAVFHEILLVLEQAILQKLRNNQY
jgi:hypothetical protein